MRVTKCFVLIFRKPKDFERKELSCEKLTAFLDPVKELFCASQKRCKNDKAQCSNTGLIISLRSFGWFHICLTLRRGL